VAGMAANGEPTEGATGEIRIPRQACRGHGDEILIPRQAGAETPGPVRDERRGEVVLRHARLTGRGRPTFCSPSRAEQAGVVKLSLSGTDGKVIYPTREAAEAAARELESLGARRLRPYLCARSRHGHFHLATDTSRPLHERIPQQRRPA
jgi:hypothetical protein